ncbi:hypothetical protein L2E82_14432 [Cichorium intybus]|uniref:Uncharacterized protein n=1 Tax=Cichorium intybus TaxID=13427 RepID=A0ACB9EZF4_CICIN|nr:hypothetical protein L2E82_14432 [Cichorium intybus]
MGKNICFRGCVGAERLYMCSCFIKSCILYWFLNIFSLNDRQLYWIFFSSLLELDRNLGDYCCFLEVEGLNMVVCIFYGSGLVSLKLLEIYKL